MDNPPVIDENSLYRDSKPDLLAPLHNVLSSDATFHTFFLSIGWDTQKLLDKIPANTMRSILVSLNSAKALHIETINQKANIFKLPVAVNHVNDDTNIAIVALKEFYKRILQETGCIVNSLEWSPLLNDLYMALLFEWLQQNLPCSTGIFMTFGLLTKQEHNEKEGNCNFVANTQEKRYRFNNFQNIFLEYPVFQRNQNTEIEQKIAANNIKQSEDTYDRSSNCLVVARIRIDGYDLDVYGPLFSKNEPPMAPLDANIPSFSIKMPNKPAQEYECCWAVTLNLPRNGRSFPFAFNARGKAQFCAYKMPTITASSTLPVDETWILASDTTLENGEVSITMSRAGMQTMLCGKILFTTSNRVQASGNLDATIDYHSNEPKSAILSLLSDGKLTIIDSCSLSEGTIGFALNQPSDKSKPDLFAQQFSDDNVLLFQTKKPIALQTASITGIGDKPITLEANLFSADSDTTILRLTVYPSWLKIAIFGKDTVLFLHGKEYDEPFNMDLNGSWCGHISSNVQLSLCCAADPAAPPIVAGTAPLCGTLECYGLTQRLLRISASLNYASIFPETSWSQNLPSQEFAATLVKDQFPEVHIFLDKLVFDSFQIRQESGIEKQQSLISSTLEPCGLRFPSGLILNKGYGSETEPIRLPRFTLNSTCQVIMDNGERLEIVEWLSRF